MRESLLALLASILVGAALPVSAEQVGVVFVDSNRNGVRDTGEPGRGGVVTTNGHDVVTTGLDGSFALPDRGHFVYITRPDGFDCERWYRRDAGNFALVPEPTRADEFFFVHMTDVHAYEDAQDMLEYSIPTGPWYMPQYVTTRIGLYFLRSNYRVRDETLAQKLRDALPDPGSVADQPPPELLQTYVAEFGRNGSPLGAVGEAVREALAEIDALGPAFVVNTGDLVLESNRGEQESIERWFRFYQAVTRELDTPVYDTIGNNEIAGTENDDFGPDDPHYGKHFFRKFYGPTHYSFDHGGFHFTALDTHRPDPGFFDDEDWSFESMNDEVRAWLDADLALHAGRTIVALNHEPFHSDPNWPFEYDHADDAGLFAKHGVAYSLSGHLHRNGYEQTGATEHVTTGALSGFRWFLPESLHERGYRLVYARGGRLYSSWKHTGQAVVRWLDDGVGVAADAAGPFDRIEAHLGDRTVPLERWGDYFVRLAEPGKTGVLVGVRADGTRVESPFGVSGR